MRPLQVIFIFLLVTHGTICLGSRILRVSGDGNSILFANDKARKWKAKDKICVDQDDEQVVCGEVSIVTPEGISAVLPPYQGLLVEGDKVRYSGPPDPLETPATPPASDSEPDFLKSEQPELGGEGADVETANSGEVEPASRPESVQDPKDMTRIEIVKFHRDLIYGQSAVLDEDMESGTVSLFRRQYLLYAGGMGLLSYSPSFLWGYGGMEYATADKFAWGGQIRYYGYLADYIPVKSTELMATVSYYIDEPFDGPQFRLGLGAATSELEITATSKAQLTTYSGMVSLGWRWLINHRTINIGILAGVEGHYVPGFSLGTRTATATVVVPTVYLDIGFAF